MIKRHKRVKISIQEARQVLYDAFKKDDDFEMAYTANIAMLLFDHYDKADFSNWQTRNQAADDIMKRIFG